MRFLPIVLLWCLLPVVAQAAEPGAPEAARRLVEGFEARLASAETSEEDLLEALDLVSSLYARTKDANLRERIVAGALAATVRGEIDVATGTNAQDRVQGRALRLLGETGSPDVGRRLRVLLEMHHLDGARSHPTATFWVHAFIALARTQDTASIDWMVERFALRVDRTLEGIDRTGAALVALEHVRAFTPAQRLRIANGLVSTWLDVETRGDDPNVHPRERLWSRVGARVVAALRTLGRAPTDEHGFALKTVEAFATWISEHDDAAEAPWSE